ncbi:hypothetical protein GUJ93_ZPchr0008g11516 [Zizania palustris]|uniref:NOG1 N-terminal helical domain-containing protein n=1 Tax=Zizania palustris TaxID=103762 RepID=A0A8J5RIT7_ZIZPA|nr:hypothetical protein GUJ93_ZPchr0008g11516 [Zizania palustris]
MRAVAGGRGFLLLHPRPPWRALSAPVPSPSPPPPAAVTSIALVRRIRHRHFPEGSVYTFHLCRLVHSARCAVTLDDRSQAEPVNGEKANLLQKHEMVGAFQRIPMVMPPIDILMSAQRKSRNVPPTKGITNIAKRERNKGAKQLDALMKELSVPLRTYTENFPKRRDLHPYERSLIELTFGEGYYEKAILRVDALRKKINSVGKQHASVCAKVRADAFLC